MKKEIKSFLIVYLFTWIFTFLLFLLNLLDPQVTFKAFWENYVQIISSTSGFTFLHIIIFLFYIIFLITQYFIRVYRKKGLKTFTERFTFRLATPILLIIVLIKSLLYINNNEDFDYQWNYAVENKTDTVQDLYAIDGKHRGMGVYDFGRSNRTTYNELIKTNIEWVQILPYFYQESETTNEIQNIKELGVWSRRDSAFIKSIQQLHTQNIRVQLKPHLWMSSGWRSNINFDNEEDWNFWFESYRKTILHYAIMAEKTKTELYCIGTELRSSVRHQPEKWKTLIKEIKQIYSGELTYAANWDDNFDNIDFWDELDYIGIQGYFPLTEESNPSLVSIQKGWQSHKEMLQKLSKKYKKKILFTEVGYRPDLNGTKKPWEWESVFWRRLFKKKSNKTQYLAFEALYSELWKEKWFAGTYIWQWNNSDFEIKGRPAENSVAKWYSNINSN
ncbi:hypothetical protein [uncultured Maribacter sp.]|uniref:glycoside hydrolase family 113 n=1 Tax=uncultured Maribacter sp. TaxID=431308 RepID=UPI00261C7363|nr:hypothetical protein [uncultured Maribacter sp.]